MSRRAKVVPIAWLIVALLPLAALAATKKDEPIQQSGQVRSMERSTEFQSKLEKASRLIGAKVMNDKNERLGTVENIVLTSDHSAVSYVVLSHGGLWNRGGKLFAVPWSRFDIRAQEKVLVLDNVSPADLNNAKGFNRNHWPVAARENWLDRGMTGSPAVSEPKAMKADIRYCRLSKLVGLPVKNNHGERLGALKDMVIDIHDGRVAYGVLSIRSGLLNTNKELAAVPWSSLQILPRMRMARLDAAKETLQAIAFKANNFPNLEDRQYTRQIHERFGAKPYWETLGYVPGTEAEHREGSQWKEGSSYDSQYKVDMVKTIHGTVERIGTFRLKGMAEKGLRLRVKTDDGKMMTVQAGPRSYVERQNVGFHRGDEVTVTGSTGKMGWHNVIVASQIKVGDKTLELRTNEGKPMWNVSGFESTR